MYANPTVYGAIVELSGIRSRDREAFLLLAVSPWPYKARIKIRGGNSENRTTPLLLRYYYSRDLWHPVPHNQPEKLPKREATSKESSKKITIDREGTAKRRRGKSDSGGFEGYVPRRFERSALLCNIVSLAGSINRIRVVVAE